MEKMNLTYIKQGKSIYIWQTLASETSFSPVSKEILNATPYRSSAFMTYNLMVKARGVHLGKNLC